MKKKKVWGPPRVGNHGEEWCIVPREDKLRMMADWATGVSYSDIVAAGLNPDQKHIHITTDIVVDGLVQTSYTLVRGK